MKDNRGEDADSSASAGTATCSLISHNDVWDRADKRAFLMTPREEFVTADNLSRAYEWHYLNIGFGVTITGPHTVARMTNTLAVKPRRQGARDRHRLGLPVGLSVAPDRQAVVDRDHPRRSPSAPAALYDSLIARGYSEYCGDPDQERRRLLRLGGGGAVRQDHRHLRHRPHPAAAAAAAEARRNHGHSGRPARRAARAQGGQEPSADGGFAVSRSDIYNGAIIPFVPFTGGHQS